MAGPGAGAYDATQQRHEKRHTRHGNADQIARRIDFDIAKHWQLNAAFFRRTSKPYTVEAIKEAASESYSTIAKGLPKFGKAEAIEAAIDAMSGQRPGAADGGGGLKLPPTRSPRAISLPVRGVRVSGLLFRH